MLGEAVYEFPVVPAVTDDGPVMSHGGTALTVTVFEQ
jgi:hypothetical protein